MSKSSQSSKSTKPNDFATDVTNSLQDAQIDDSKDDNGFLDAVQHVEQNHESQATTTTSSTAATDDIKESKDTADTGLDDCCDYIDDWSDFSKKMELLGDFVEYLDKGFDYFEVLEMAAKANQAKAAKAKEEDEKRLIFGSGMGDSPCTNEVSALKSKYGMRCCCVTCDPDDPLNKYGDIDARRPLNKDESMADFEYINEAYTMEYNIDGLPQDTDFLTGLRNAEAIKRYEQLRFRRLLKLEEQDKKNEDSN